MDGRVRDLTLMLLYVTAWGEKTIDLESGDQVVALRSWKSYDWDAIDSLTEQGLIDGAHKAKSVWLTDEGVAEARQLLGRYGLDAG
ncbi:MAG: DUF6429 family protein [Propionibacteriaceae bacterium]|jgi:hypothetical protein|nr:DUF6429 family protein [Propionibacteriaceae bacterium]